MVVVPAEVFRSRVLTDPRLSDTVLEAFLARRAALMSTAADTLQIIGSEFTPASMALREYAARNRLPHHWIDADTDPDIAALLDGLGVIGGRPADRHHPARPAQAGDAWRPRLQQLGHDGRRAAGALLRRGGRRCRAGRAGGVGVRRVRGPAHADGRRRRRRRSGRHQLADRELPRASRPASRVRTWRRGPRSRRRSSARSSPARARSRRSTTSPGTSSPRCPTASRSPAAPSWPPPARTTASCPSPGSSATRWPASTTRRPSSEARMCAGRTASPWSAAATRPARRRCSSPRRLVGVRRRASTAERDDVELPRRPDRQPSPRPGARGHDGHRARTATRRWNASRVSRSDTAGRRRVHGAVLVHRCRTEQRLARWRRRRRARLRAHRPRPRPRRAGRRVVCDRVAGPCRTRRAGPACSPSATSARDRPSGSPPPSARARPRSARSTSTSPSPSTPDRNESGPGRLTTSRPPTELSSKGDVVARRDSNRDLWQQGDRVWVSEARQPLRPARAARVSWEHVVGAFRYDVLGDRLEGRPLAVASNRVRDLIERGLVVDAAGRRRPGLRSDHRRRPRRAAGHDRPLPAQRPVALDRGVGPERYE